MNKFKDNQQYRKTYHVWYTMVWRCSRTSGHFYKYYGARGLKVCERWLIFSNFLKDMGLKPAALSLERIDNARGYNPDNCKWATKAEQSRNMRINRFVVIDGKKKTVSEWARYVHKNQSTASRWLTKGESYFIERVKSLQG